MNVNAAPLRHVKKYQHKAANNQAIKSVHWENLDKVNDSASGIPDGCCINPRFGCHPC